jgi:DNA polymerase
MDPNQARRILRQHVETDRLLGVESVPLGQPQPATAQEPVAAPAPAPKSPVVSARPGAIPPEGGTPLWGATAPAAPRLTTPQKIEVLHAMDDQEVRACTQCPLCHSRTHTVFGEGDPDARLMFIGEGPGQTEDEMGRPFVGRAGELLDKMIAAMQFQREQVYIANVVKCRPPENRTPTPGEALACFTYLRRQVLTIAPAVIVTLGGPATKTLLDTQTGITALRGMWQEFTGLVPQGPVIPVMPTFHPAYLLRNYSPDTRKKVWSDLKQVMEKLKQLG